MVEHLCKLIRVHRQVHLLFELHLLPLSLYCLLALYVLHGLLEEKSVVSAWFAAARIDVSGHRLTELLLLRLFLFLPCDRLSIIDCGFLEHRQSLIIVGLDLLVLISGQVAKLLSFLC